MKMVMIICPDQRREEIRAVIEEHAVPAFSELKDVTGEGATGKHMGTRLWPGTSRLLFTVLDDEKKNELMAALHQCANHLYPGEGLRAFVMPVEETL
jgi:nitrogen regulatory protein PII